MPDHRFNLGYAVRPFQNHTHVVLVEAEEVVNRSLHRIAHAEHGNKQRRAHDQRGQSQRQPSFFADGVADGDDERTLHRQKALRPGKQFIGQPLAAAAGTDAQVVKGLVGRDLHTVDDWP